MAHHYATRQANRIGFMTVPKKTFFYLDWYRGHWLTPRLLLGMCHSRAAPMAQLPLCPGSLSAAL